MSDSSPSLGRTALTTGATLAGAYAGLAATTWAYRQTLPRPLSLPPALDLDARPVEVPDGRAQVYAHPGEGTPVVLLHSFNAAASSREMQPIAAHIADTTSRPVYALDWLGFGRSDRAPIDYTPGVYRRQLYHFLAEVPDAPVDLVALSRGGEYAAQFTLQAAPLVRRLVLISPTGLGEARGLSPMGKLGLSLASTTGAFELLYHRLTRRASLHDYYARQIFLAPNAVPDALLDYAALTAHVRGAHHAPLRFVDGTLSLDNVASAIYARLYRPTLLLTPEAPESTVQSFGRLPALLNDHSRDLAHTALPGGLLPHWEAPAACFQALDSFLSLK